MFRVNNGDTIMTKCHSDRMKKIIYKKLYPAGSTLFLFYGNAKIHKLLSNDANDLPLSPIVSNIGKATYETAKYLTKLLSPLRNFETVEIA